MSLTTPFQVRKLRKALGEKAKESPSYRFYALYDKLYRRDILAFAYDAARPMAERRRRRDDLRGCRGVWRGEWLDELATTLKEQTYQPLSAAAGVHTRSRTGNNGRWGYQRSQTA